jgi:CheY-like chemotaxis protein
VVKVANNGREAVEILLSGPQSAPFDVVLMDLQMPEMDGYQATAKLRADARCRALPIIAMTAHATIEERRRCLEAGMNDHIPKPIDPALLFEMVGRFYIPKGESGADGVIRPTSPAAATSTGDDLPFIAGLDTKDGLARVAGNRKLYLKLLRLFVERQGGAGEQVASALANGDIILAERLSHTLNGVAGNIGATEVRCAAGLLEKLIRDRADAAEVDSARHKVAAALEPLIAQLQVALSAVASEPPSQAVATPDPAQCRQAAADLSKLLSESDPGAADFIESNLAALRPLFDHSAWTQFEESVQDYAFADARALLENALKK